MASGIMGDGRGEGFMARASADPLMGAALTADVPLNGRLDGTIRRGMPPLRDEGNEGGEGIKEIEGARSIRW